MRFFLRRIGEFIGSLLSHQTPRWMFYGIILGVATGILGLVYYKALDGAIWLVSLLTGFHMPTAGGEGGREEIVVTYRWVLLVAPAVGGLLVGLLHRFYTADTIDATDGYINFFHRRRARMDIRKPLWRLLTSILTMSSGGSAGKEGPVIFVSGAMGSWIAKLLRLSEKERSILTVCGAGGGLGAVFRAPVGGALYAAEVLYRQAEFESDAVMPAIITSITAYAVFALFGNWLPVFTTPHYSFRVLDLPFFGILGFVAPAFAFLYTRSLKYSERFFRLLRVPSWLKPALGGLAVGVILLFLPHVAGTSYGVLQMAIYGKLVIWIVLAIALAKIAATSLTIGSGGSGGLFAPALVIGGLVGAAFGQSLNMIGIHVQHEAFVLVGMGAFLSAAAKVPLASIIMIAEMAGNYELLVPMTLAASLAFMASRRFSIYPSQVPARWQSPAHRGEFAVDILEEMRVADTMAGLENLPCFGLTERLEDVLRAIADLHGDCYPVVDEDGNTIGAIMTDDMRKALYQGELDAAKEFLVVKDVARRRVPFLSPDDDLHQALEVMDREGLDELLVVRERRCVGCLSRRAIIRVYEKELARRKDSLGTV